MTKTQVREFINRYKSGQHHLKLLDDIMVELQKVVPDVPDPPFDEIVALYHRHLPTLPKVLKLNDARRAGIRARWSELAAHRTIEFWDALFRRAAQSDFLMGRKTDWCASFDFFLQPSSLTKLLEGTYDNRGTRRTPVDVLDYAAGIGQMQRQQQGR